MMGNVSRLNMAHWMAVILLVASSLTTATVSLLLIPLSHDPALYLVLIPLGISLVLVLVSVWLSKVLITEAERRGQERLEIAKLEAELEMTQRTRELHHDLINHLSAVSSWIQLGAGDRAIRYIHQILGSLHSNNAERVGTDPHLLSLLLGMVGQKLVEAEEHGVSLHLEFDSRWAQVAINDEVAIRIMGNLIDNALSAASRSESEQGRVEIAVFTQSDAACLRVWNNGPPIPDAIRRRLEEPGRTQRPKETGLGLNIVRKLVEESKASLRVLSDDEKGTEIFIRFPLRAEGP